ncbi:MAG TPA: MarR family winged helix-turn-helix transcriptional regulator [Cellulomonas sp.]
MSHDASVDQWHPGTDEWRDLAIVVHQLARRLRQQSLALARIDAVPPTTAEVLRVIVNRPGVSIHEIAAVGLLQQSNVSAAVTDLCRRGLVSKTTDPQDRRRVLVHPTPQAIDNGRRIESAWAHLYAQAVAGMDPVLVGLLRAATPALLALDDRLDAVVGADEATNGASTTAPG